MSPETIDLIKEVSLAALGTSAIVLPAWWTSISKTRVLEFKLEEIEKRGTVTNAAHEFFFNIFSRSLEVCEELIDVLEETKIDRIFFLVAYNGKTDPKYCDGLVMLQEGKFHLYVYKDLKLDAPYLEMLKNISVHGSVYLSTESMPEGMLKVIYEREGVKSSLVRDLYRYPDGQIFYCSAASHSGELSPSCITRCEPSGRANR